MIIPLAIATGLLAVFDDDNSSADIDELFKRAVAFDNGDILLDEIDEGQKKVFLEKLKVWYSTSSSAEERLERKRIVKIFTDIMLYDIVRVIDPATEEVSTTSVTLDRMPIICFDDGTDHETLAWILNPKVTVRGIKPVVSDYPVLSVILKSGVEISIGFTEISDNYVLVYDQHTHGLICSVPIEDVEAFVVM